MTEGKFANYPLLQDIDSDSDIENVNVSSSQHKGTSNLPRQFSAAIVIVFLLSVTSAIVYISFYSTSKSVVQKVNTHHLETLVFTECGFVSGVSDFDVAHESFTFKGIPYAKPPIGNLRWKPPVRLSDDKKDCWKGVFTADTFGSRCVQGSEGSEDCLYLNIYTPTLSNTSNLPVFIWIHGGYLLSGHGNMIGYSPSGEFVNAMGVVAVSMNYRLNAFGFLTLEEFWEKDKSYGNYGFMDQILVLKWVQSNIRNFGGDPNSVTICGQSSGGTSIFGLLASPLADGLFHKAIPMSGSPKLEKSYVVAAEDNIKFINKSVKCKDVPRGDKLRHCFYAMSAKEVTSCIPYKTYPNWGMDDLLDFPTHGLFDGALAVIDPIVIPKPIKELSKLKFLLQKKIPVLIGSTAQEIAFQPVREFNGSDAWTEVCRYLKNRTDVFSPNYIDLLWGKLYVNETDKNGRVKSAQYLFETLVTDVRVTCPLNRLAKDFSNSSHHEIYRYVVEHVPYKAMKFSFQQAQSKHAFHAWDAVALFNFQLVTEVGYKPKGTDFVFRDSIRKHFKDFIKHGKLDNWDHGQTGVFRNDGKVHVQHGYHMKQCTFWSNTTNGFRPYAWIN